MKLKAIKLEKERRLTKHGSYSLALTAVVIAAAVVVNLIVSELPSKYTQIDLTSAQLSVLTEQSEELLDSLTEDITIYYVVQDSNRDTNVSRLLERYAGASGHIKLVEKDPVRYPKFTEQYTDASLTENSVIIECGEQSRVINYEDMYESEFDYEYYSYETTGFDAEGQITSAIAALSSGNLPKVYMLTGHNEMTVGTSLQSSIEKENVETAELNLISEERVPEDADAVMILSPQQDLTDAETQKLFHYLKTGGRAVIVTDYTDVEMPNLESVLEYYGMEKAEGVVLESDNGHYVQVPYYLLPEVESTEVSEDLTGSYVLLAAAQGLTVSDDLRDGLTVTNVLSTSDNAYSKTDVQNMKTYAKESGDIDGPFAVGAIASETVELTEELLAEAAEDTGDVSLGTALDELQIADDTAEEEAGTEEAGATEEETGAEEADVAEETGAEEADAAEEVTAAEDTSAEETEAEESSSEGETETAETRVAVFTSSSLLDESANQMVSGGNYRLFVNTVSWLCGNETTVSIPVKNISTEYLTVPAASASFWSIVTIGIIPAGFLLTGLYTWLKRRRQ
ncbi:GldG family protein [Marvinbryantia sp.]|uniref:GldG family protein n=1 Tax=Marvinbryantia sp. TaxID=2496532 RepID=UPI0025D9A048|nr:GldG family protein [uncultured Marvinbryantia sp.]